MSDEKETYEIYMANGTRATFDKNTNLLIENSSCKYIQEYSKAVLEAWDILKTSPYINYKPNYLDPEFHTGQSSTLLQFKDWQKIYLKDPVKGAIAPWTKAEKAYYQSLKTKRERYKYLIIRSGLRSSVIDIPFEAYCNIDEQGNIINKDYKELYAKVEANRGLAHLSDGYLFMAEWELAAGFLGDRLGFAKGGGGEYVENRLYYKSIPISIPSSAIRKPAFFRTSIKHLFLLYSLNRWRTYQSFTRTNAY